MDPKLRIVVTLPLDELWDDRGTLSYRRVQWLSVDEVRERLKKGPAQFVVASVGLRLQWIPLTDSFAFWRRTAASLAPPTQAVDLDSFPDGRCYLASLWQAASSDEVIVLECQH